MPTLVLAVDQFSWMMSSVPQVLTSYWSVPADQSYPTTVSTLLMLVWDVKVDMYDTVLWSSGDLHNFLLASSL